MADTTIVEKLPINGKEKTIKYLYTPRGLFAIIKKLTKNWKTVRYMVLLNMPTGLRYKSFKFSV